MANILVFDPSGPETFLSYGEKLSGIRSILESYATRYGLPDLVNRLKAGYTPELNLSKLKWDKILGQAEITCLLLALGQKRIRNLTVQNQIDLLTSREIYITDPSLWDNTILARTVWPSLMLITSLRHVDYSFCLNEYQKPKSEQIKVIERHSDLPRFFKIGATPPTVAFSDFVDTDADRFHCSWWKALDEQRQQQKRAEEARKAAEEKARQQARQRQLQIANPRAVLRLAPDCPDWMVEIYWRALVKAIHPDRHNGSGSRDKLTAMLALVNEAHDKIKEQRGPAWSPEKLPWKEGETK